MISNKNAQDLIDIIERNAVDLDIPHISNNSIRIKNYVIRKNKKGDYNIFDIAGNRRITTTNFKHSAIAFTKLLISNKPTEKILKLDKELLKHYNDSLFYKNSISNSKDFGYKEVREVRLDISIQQTRKIQKKLESYIFH